MESLAICDFEVAAIRVTKGVKIAFGFEKVKLERNLGCRKWGCHKWGLKGCLAALPGNRPKSAFLALFLPFSPLFGGPEEHLENPENGGKNPFSLDIL